MTDYYPPYVTHNCLVTAYEGLRTLGRFVEDSHISPYRQFFEKVMDKSMEGEILNQEVESYYLNKMTEGEFVSTAKGRLYGGDSDLMERLLTATWNTLLVVPANAQVCGDHCLQAGRQLWEIFLRLDTESHRGLHAEDVSDLATRIFKANDHIVKPEEVMSWFSNPECVPFWEFFSIMTRDYKQMLQTPVLTELYDMISTETIKEGKLAKKGHIVPNWKGRWFTLRATSLTYREAKDAPILKTIVINDKTQVQNMPETKGHVHRFRVLDGSSATPTEISATDEFTMREWMAFIKLAVKMNQIAGRNFLHKYRLAINSFPKSFFSQTTSLPAFTAAPILPQVKTTSPTHKALKSSHSVPVVNEVEKGQGNNTLPIIIQEGVDSPDGWDLNDAPPVPPQRFGPNEPEVTAQRKNVPQVAVVKQASNSGRPKARRRSSLDSSDIEHIQVDGDLEYAVVTVSKKKKKPKPKASSTEEKPPDPPARKASPVFKKKSKSTETPPLSSHTSPLPPPHTSTPPPPPPHTSTPPPPPPHASTPPQQVPPRRMLSSDIPLPSSRSPHTSPTNVRKGYAELQFEEGKATETTPSKPTDVTNKFGYSELHFEGNKEQEKDSGGGVVKEEEAPPPPPRHGGMGKSTTESNVLGHNPHSTSNGSHSKPPRTKPTSLPDLAAKSTRKQQRNLDYAEVVFDGNPAVSPSVTHRILSDEHVSGSTAPRVSYATVILNPEQNEKPASNHSKPPKDSGYENFDFTPCSNGKDSKKQSKQSGYVNIDYSSVSAEEEVYENSHDLLINGPKVAGSARLVTSETRKPRAAPRKGVSGDRPPVPLARK